MDEWMLIVTLSISAAKWLQENSKVELTPSTSQVHLQPSKSIKKKNGKKHKKKSE